MSPLEKYTSKRDFTKTPEPKARVAAKGKALRFVVQRHEASRLHYDFRLELGGVLKSWAVPKGPSLNPADKRLAVFVEDHPVDYISFQGEIPKGNYGAGTVQIWDEGTYEPVDAKQQPVSIQKALENLEHGELKFNVKGAKISGGFVLVRLKDDEKNWLLIKHKDDFSVEGNYDSENFIGQPPKKKMTVAPSERPSPVRKGK